jgi:hypothetical protein
MPSKFIEDPSKPGEKPLTLDIPEFRQHELAQKQAEKNLSPEEKKELDKERAEYDEKMKEYWARQQMTDKSSLILEHMRPEDKLPEPGPMMKKVEEQANKILEETKQKVESEMSPQERKQLAEERAQYERAQEEYKEKEKSWGMLHYMGAKPPEPPEPGPMMKEYDKRVEKALGGSGVEEPNIKIEDPRL